MLTVYNDRVILLTYKKSHKRDFSTAYSPKLGFLPKLRFLKLGFSLPSLAGDGIPQSQAFSRAIKNYLIILSTIPYSVASSAPMK